jgi:hypothetical protein
MFVEIADPWCLYMPVTNDVMMTPAQNWFRWYILLLLRSAQSHYFLSEPFIAALRAYTSAGDMTSSQADHVQFPIAPSQSDW